MEALYLKSQGLAPADISRLCAISKTTFYRSLHEYRTGGIEKLKEVPFHQRQSQLADYRASIEAAFLVPHQVAVEPQGNPDGSPAGPTVRQFISHRNETADWPNPAKADVTYKNIKTEQLEPLRSQAANGSFLYECSPFVLQFWTVWCFERLFVKAPNGRQRLNVLAALNATTREIFSVKNLTYITSETVCELLRLLAGAHPGVLITVVLDNARYQRCALVQNLAASLGIELLFLPAYSPNLNLIERLWKFVKKTCLYSKYYADHHAFQQAIIACIAQAPTKYREELESLLTLKFQTFKDVPVIGEESNVCLFPIVKTAQRKVSSKAA
jgi:transposase